MSSPGMSHASSSASLLHSTTSTKFGRRSSVGKRAGGMIAGMTSTSGAKRRSSVSKPKSDPWRDFEQAEATSPPGSEPVSPKRPDPLSPTSCEQKLSAETWYKHVAFIRKQRSPVEVHHVPLLLQSCYFYGLRDIIQNVGVGRIPEKEELLAMAERHCPRGSFTAAQFSSFVEELARTLGITERLLVTALTQAMDKGQLLMDENMVKWFFDALPKPYAKGQAFSTDDFIRLCERCGWLTADSFTQGDALALFRFVCQHRKVGWSVGTKTPFQSHEKVGNAQLVGKVLEISELQDYEHLLEKVAEVQKRPSLQVLAEVLSAAETFPEYFRNRRRTSAAALLKTAREMVDFSDLVSDDDDSPLSASS